MIASSPPHISPDDQVLLFDGVCALCRGWGRFIIRTDKHCRIRLCSVQSDAGQDLLRHFDLPTDQFDTLVFIRKGQPLLRSRAVLAVLTELGWPWKLAGVFRLIPVGLSDWLYTRLARNRYRLFGMLNGGVYDQCLLPTSRHSQRFVTAEQATEG
ncbi:thiol-disulfide oxidoreductase DCC family protein [Spongiibacter taiwanensis]|uniref:thiol-disulfide oxidoreductase DCC family protein n=1 Tax=Spongiibacter taiwanensis TaxID=1748242 RepID=UPI0020360573|nr:thiol-disulfide oxidoreductase DCC family protein [Spongiibacter taiwanensis]USA42387.1 thiol-disulfide oxidoreductase DCC family protein [Spongiibacter taiwanensis]